MGKADYMSLDLATLNADFDVIQADLPVTFTYNSASYTGLVSDIESSQQGIGPGFIRDYQALLFVRVATVEMNLGAKVTIGTKDYRVIRKTPDPAASVIRYDLATVSK